MSVKEKTRQVYRIAQHLFSASVDWVTFYREVLGARGVVRTMFPTRELLEAFEQSDEYAEIQRMLTRLRLVGSVTDDSKEPTRVITVRIPKSLHDAIRIEAHEHKTSMNKLCISKLLQFVDPETVPAELPDSEPRDWAGALGEPKEEERAEADL